MSYSSSEDTIYSNIPERPYPIFSDMKEARPSRNKADSNLDTKLKMPDTITSTLHKVYKNGKMGFCCRKKHVWKP